jgi:signal peptidase II
VPHLPAFLWSRFRLTDNISARPAPIAPNAAWLALLAPAALVLLIDQLTKLRVVQTLGLGQSVYPIPALADFFAITLSHNTGAAFSLLPQAGDLFLIIALVMVVGIIFFYRRLPRGLWPERTALGLLLGGTAGNALDRLTRGYVVDWVHLQLPGVISNVSNLADHAIVLSILVLFVRQWRGQAQSGAG